jgi:hypothetical protein
MCPSQVEPTINECKNLRTLDSRVGDAFTIDVRDCEPPLDVFHHPYAYAGAHGIETHAAPHFVA